MLPHEKELVKRLENQPFALIGINSDGDAAALTKILADNGITWRQAVDGSTSGKLASTWNVQGWPTIYVIDAKGVIRFRNLRDDELATAVSKLLEEAKARK